MNPNFDQISFLFGVLISSIDFDHDFFFSFAHCNSEHGIQIHGVCIFNSMPAVRSLFARPARRLVFWPPTLPLGSTVCTC